MRDRYNVPVNALHLKSSCGLTVQWMAGPRAVIQVGSGHGDAELARLMVDGLTRELQGLTDIVCFFDGLAFTGYDPAFRVTMAEGARRLMATGQFKTLRLLTRSKIVAMGVSVANLAVRSNFEVYSNAAAFDRALIDCGGGAALATAGTARQA